MGSGGSKTKHKPSSAPTPNNQNKNAGDDDVANSKQKQTTPTTNVASSPPPVSTTDPPKSAKEPQGKSTTKPSSNELPKAAKEPQSVAKQQPENVDKESEVPVKTEVKSVDDVKKNDENSENKGDNSGNKGNNSSSEKQTEQDTDTAKPNGNSDKQNVEATKTETNENESDDNSNAGNNKTKVLEIEEDFIPQEAEEQRKFDDAVSSVCLLVKPDSIIKKVTKNVTKLQLARALPYTFNLYGLLTKMTSLQELDISNNNIGPQGVRSICLAMCTNSSILSLNLAGNKSDTDSADSLGKMISANKTLEYLDVSSNYFGKDYFSRCVGPALKINTSLKTLRAESIGTTDVKLLIEGLQQNTSLTELDLSRNGVSDRVLLGKGFAECLKRENCCLTTLNLCNCEMNATGLEAFREGLQSNTSITELNLGGNEFGSLENLLKFVVTAASHPKMKTLSLDEAKVKETSIKSKDIKPREGEVSLHSISLSNDNLTDEFWEVLAAIFKGRQLPLTDINLNSNENLTPKCVHSIVDLTSGEDSPSTVRKISYGLNKADGLATELLAAQLPYLNYLNTRKSKMADIQQLSQLYTVEGRRLTTLILDGLKLASTKTLEKLLDNSDKSSLTTISLGGCSLTDEDLKPLCLSIKAGLQLHMLKISANRIPDAGVFDLVEALLSHKTHPLAVLDISTNVIEDEGAKRLSTLFTTKKHTSNLHSLNVYSNSIGKEGLLSFVSVIGGKFPLRTLYLSDQTKSQDEGDMVAIFNKLAASLGFTVKKQGDVIELGCSDIPSIPEGLVVAMKGLGGNTGEIGKMMDSPRIRTDYTHDQLPTLSFEHCQEISAYLKGTGSDVCVWSSDEWKQITGADRPTTDTPSWLQIANSRNLAVYISNLPGNATIQKMEALFEMDADCNIDEISLMKDPVTRKINGVGWGLLCDQESIQKAINFFRSGEAKIFGQAFMISKVNVNVDDEVNSQSEAKARQELEDRMTRMQKEEKAHRVLIQRRAEEQWKRHAYRLAHPAYADGRIW